MATGATGPRRRLRARDKESEMSGTRSPLGMRVHRQHVVFRNRTCGVCCIDC